MNPQISVPTAGMFCVPTAIEILTGSDPQSVIFPALNRAAHRDDLLTDCAGEHMSNTCKVLEELGLTVRRYKGGELHSLVQTWTKRFPDRVVLIAAGGKGQGHCMVLANGKIYDSWFPMGINGDGHAYSTAKVTWAALVEDRAMTHTAFLNGWLWPALAWLAFAIVAWWFLGKVDVVDREDDNGT